MPEDRGVNASRLLIPNFLTLTRVLAGAALFVVTADGPFLFILVLLGGISDWLDGLLARMLGAVSRFGAAFDLIADAVFLTSAYLAMWRLGLLPLFWFAVIFLLTALKWFALGIQVRSGIGVASTGRIWNRLLGICSYSLLIGVAFGLPYLPFVLVLVPVQVWAHGMDLRLAVAGPRE
jgi:phosphatidylglycerophosphate synthase